MKKKLKKTSRFRKQSDHIDDQESGSSKKLRIKKSSQNRKKIDWRDLIVEEKDDRLHDE
jgi:hypothetical protein